MPFSMDAFSVKSCASQIFLLEDFAVCQLMAVIWNRNWGWVFVILILPCVLDHMSSCISKKCDIWGQCVSDQNTHTHTLLDPCMSVCDQVTIYNESSWNLMHESSRRVFLSLKTNQPFSLSVVTAFVLRFCCSYETCCSCSHTLNAAVTAARHL